MTTLADKSLLSGGDNKPPMLEKHLYDSWKSRMELYMMNRPHEAIQADCDIKAINIILQGLPTEIYAPMSQHRVAKDLWEKIKLLMQGTSLTKQERERPLATAEDSRSKMLLKHKDNMMLEKEKQNSVNSSEPTLSIRPTNVEVPKELPKVSMVNTSLKKLKHHLANFDVEKALAITALKDELRKLKGKALVDNNVSNHPSDPELHQVNEMLSKISKTCPSINSSGEQLVVVTPMNKVKRVRFTEPVTSSRNTKTAHTSNLASNKPMLSSTGVKQSTSASGSQPSGNTKKDKIQQTPSSTLKNKHSKLNANYELKCIKCNGCMLFDNHDLCVLKFINNVNAHAKSRPVKKNSKRKVAKTNNERITTTTEVPLRKSSALDNKTPKPVVTLVYLRKPRKSKTSVPLTAMASEHSSSGPALHEMTPATISSGLVPNPHPSTPFVPPSRTDWDMLFQPLFDEFLNPSPSVDHPAPEVVAPINEVIAPVLADSTGSPSSTTVDQDAPSPSNSQTTPETEPPVIPNDVEEDNHDIEVAHMGNDPYFGVPIPEIPSDQSSSSDSIHTIVHPDHQISEHNSKWTKDHPLENIIGELARPVSTRLQLHEQALFCYYDAFLTVVEPKTYKDALTQACWIETMQEELNNFE
ncbi:hypothetical protein Tco_0397194 [Tanacetum coccineum]